MRKLKSENGGRHTPCGICPDFVLCVYWQFFYLSRDWLRSARPSLFGSPWQEISKYLAVFVLILLAHLQKLGG